MDGLAFLFVWPAALTGFGYHLGAAYIRAHLKARGIPSEQFVHPGNAPVDYLVQRMLERRPQIVGFSCYDQDVPRVRLLAERIRRFSPATAIVCGGPAATFSDQVILENCPAIDCCVRYEGEAAALELLEWVNGERPLESIRGITCRSGQLVRRTADRDPADGESESLDEWADPYLEGMIPAAEAARVGLITSRGCSLACPYCDVRRLARGRIRFHSVERVVSVLSFLERELGGAGSRTVIPIHDDNLSLDRGRLHLLLRRMAELRFQNLRFNGMMRADFLTADSFPLLRDAGFAWVQFGLESGAPQVLGAIQRVRAEGGEKDGYQREGAYLGHVAWAVDQAKSVGLGTVVSVILGCPGETEEHGRETLEFVKRLGVDEYSHGFMKVHDGTEFARGCEDSGIRLESAGLTPPLTRTRLAYPAHRLPMLDNAMPFPARTDAKMSLVMRLLTGAAENYSGAAVAQSGTGACGPVLGMSKAAPASAVRDWIGNELPYSSVVCLIDEGTGVSTGFEQPMLDGAPFEIFTLRAVPQDAGGCSWRFNELEVDALAENCMAVRSLPLAAVDWNDPAALVDPVRQTLLVTAETPGDVGALERFCAAGEAAGCWRLPLAALESCLSIADGCRWAGAPCPAAEGLRWFIGDSGGLSPCRCGARMGEVGQSPAALQEAVRRIEQAEAEKRNCEACPVSASCSRCLFPEPLGAAGFCEFRRSHFGLPALVDGLVLARLLVQAGLVPEETRGATIRSLGDRLHGEFAHDGVPVALSECLLLTLDGTGSGYLCHSRRKLLVSLAGEPLRTLETLIGGQLPSRS